MSKLWRTILFAIFACGFLISAPLVVLYTAGYRYQFGSARIVKAGVLSVVSIPKGATVSLDGVNSDKKTPAVIDNILPGQVKIHIEKSGYTSWEKTLPIESNQSTFVPGAILFLTGNPVQAVDQTAILTVATQSPTHFAYLSQNQNSLELWIRDTSLTQDHPIIKQPYHAKSLYKLSWSPDGAYLLLKESGARTAFTLLHVSDETVITLPTSNLTDAWFDVGSSHTILYTTGTELRAFGIDADISIPKQLIADDIQSRDGKLLVVQSNRQSTLSYLNANNVASIIAYLPLGQYRFLHAPSPYLLLEDTSRRHLILLDPNQKNPLLLNEEMLFSEWSPKEDRLVFSNGFDMNIYSIASNQIETITRFSEPLTDLIWYPIGDEILYGHNQALSALELDRRDERNETTLVDGYSMKKIWVSKDGSTLFFLGQKGTDPTTIFERKLQK